VIDPRGRFLTPERFPGVTLDDRWPDEAVTALQPDPATAVVTLSHDPKIDDPALIAALARRPAMSPRSARAGATRRGWSGSPPPGLAPDDLARIEGPAGLDIGAIGPAEIALSIAAAMVRSFHAEA
jgi:xanthine dehydrogenase accessory factor